MSVEEKDGYNERNGEEMIDVAFPEFLVDTAASRAMKCEPVSEEFCDMIEFTLGRPQLLVNQDLMSRCMRTQRVCSFPIFPGHHGSG